MATLQTLNSSDFFMLGEHPTNYKFEKQVYENISKLLTNEAAIDSDIKILIQDSTGGAEQGKIPFFRSSAPTGWTRDTSFTNDSILRVTDGATMPSGDSPTATGGQSGGSWTMSGITTSSAGSHTHSFDHTHSLGSHTHTYPAHTHTITSHTHSVDSHTHTVPSLSTSTVTSSLTHNNITGGTNFRYSDKQHNHDATHTHSPGNSGGITSSDTTVADTSSAAPTTGAASGASASDSPVLSTTSDHTHTISHDGSWRPAYTNVIICKKDDYVDLSAISSPANWDIREEPVSPVWNAQIRLKINDLISHASYLNTNLVSMFSGAGADQAIISFGLAASPTGWTRDTSFATDKLLRVVTGAGGGTSGGDWTITGHTDATESAHTHTVASHTHDLSSHTHTIASHTHTLNSHSHTANHTHSLASESGTTGNNSTSVRYIANVDSADWAFTSADNIFGLPWTPHTHTFAAHDHGGSVGGSTSLSASSTTTGSAGASVSATSSSTGSSAPTTSSSGSHNHGVSHDGTWRPSYLNVLVCKKD